jgi:hypothetical protein
MTADPHAPPESSAAPAPSALRRSAARPTARRFHRRWVNTGAALLALLLAAGCRPRVPPADLSLDPAALLAQVQAAQGRVRSVRGEARVHVEAEGQSGTVSQFLAAEVPDRLHLEALDFFGNPAAVLVSADGRFSLYDARQRVLYRGAATPENLARLVPLPLRAEDLVRILCGAAPLIDGRPLRAAPARGFVELVLEAGARTQTLRIGAGAAVERSALRTSGARARGDYDLALGDPRAAGAARFPGEVTLRAEAPRVRLELRWRDVEVNAALDPALFHLEPPGGARVVDLDAGGPPPPEDLLRGIKPPAAPAGGH